MTSQTFSFHHAQPAFPYNQNSQQRLVPQLTGPPGNLTQTVYLFEPAPDLPDDQAMTPLYTLPTTHALTWLIADAERGTIAFATDSEQRYLTFDPETSETI